MVPKLAATRRVLHNPQLESIQLSTQFDPAVVSAPLISAAAAADASSDVDWLDLEDELAHCFLEVCEEDPWEESDVQAMLDEKDVCAFFENHSECSSQNELSAEEGSDEDGVEMAEIDASSH